jgi:hypothetical protein
LGSATVIVVVDKFIPPIARSMPSTEAHEPRAGKVMVLELFATLAYCTDGGTPW